jgi:hypothetical protein
VPLLLLVLLLVAVLPPVPPVPPVPLLLVELEPPVPVVPVVSEELHPRPETREVAESAIERKRERDIINETPEHGGLIPRDQPLFL